MKSAALTLLFSAAKAAKNEGPIYAPTLHWNEDPNSVPSPLSGVRFVTSTQARLHAENYTGHIEAKEPKGVNPVNFHAYNTDDAEYIALRNRAMAEESESESSDSDSSDSDEEPERVQIGMKWHVSPDYGELDHNIMLREADIKNGEKESGWTNPLGWTDSGSDDDLVVTQLSSKLRYDESEGPTKVDFGDVDHVVVLREADIKNGEKASGWTNPLGWTDDGEDDESVVLQLNRA
mmetsp:Transcript_1769/g.3111  ORF Transcript_1769/g.3111 Transcript_1769/m.3111 type:complete len:235 (-) Transcript_1769:271-975(-)